MTSKRQVLLNEAKARLDSGDFDGARRSCRKLLRSRPADPDALYLLGVLQLQHGKAREAVNLICRSLDSGMQRQHAVLENLGTAYLVSGDANAAEAALRAAVEAGGSRAVMHMRLGMALMAQRKFDAAEAELRKAHELDPWDVDVVINLGNVMAALGHVDGALGLYQRARELDPANIEAIYNVGTLCREVGLFEQAIEAYSEVLRISPKHFEALNNLGTIRERMGDTSLAMDLYRQALVVDPLNAHTYSNLASALRKLGRFDEAERSCARALELHPGFVDALVNLAGLQAERGQPEAAMEIYSKAWLINPEEHEARCRYGMLGLALGRFSESWPFYQSRASRRRVMRFTGHLDENLPDSIDGATILLVGEQGIGDELFFLRGAGLLRAKNARLLCVCDGKIKSMLERTGLFDFVGNFDQPLPARDFTFVVGDLPMLLGRGQAAGNPALFKPLQLSPLPAKLQALKEYLARIGPPPYLGVTWRSGTLLTAQRNWGEGLLSKAVPLEALASALKGFGGTLVSLQRCPSPGETQRLATLTGADVFDASGLNDDLEEMLALLGLLHDYVGVSNANMHLMSGIGGRARVLVPNPPEWRWMASGNTSPWFPRFTLYRQAVDGTWDDAVAVLRADLIK
jgi:tetratricopeptide (TPR) repeat protein